MMKWIGNATGPREDYEEKNRVSSYRGYLFKLRRSQNLLAPQWGKRWFSIEGHFLKWYRQENDLFSSGMIDLKYIRSITKLEPTQRPSSGNTTTTAAALAQPPQPFSFMVSSDERNLILRATSQNEMNSWIRALHMHADIARGGKGTTVVSDFNQLPLNNGSFKLNASSSSSGNSGGMMTPNNSAAAAAAGAAVAGPSLSIKRNRGLRASMTLEQELDFTLKKLDELEKEVVTSPAPPVNIHRGDRGFYQSHDHEEEYTKENNSRNAPSSPSHFQHMTNKLLRNVASSGLTNSPFDESMESITDAIVRTPRSKVNKHQRQQQQQQVQRDLNRAESFNSIEDISLAVKPNRVKSMRRNHNNNNNNKNNNNNDNHWNRSNSNSYDDFDSHHGESKRQQVYYPANKSSNNQQQQSRFGYGRHSELAPISPASDGELSDEFDVTSRAASSPSSRQQQRRTSTRSNNTSSSNSQQNSRNQAIPNNSQSSSQGSSNYKKLGSPKRANNGGNVSLLPGNAKKFNQHFAESHDSVDFVVENIPSIDRYEEEEINITRNVGRHSIRGEQDNGIPFRKRDYVNVASVGDGGVRESKQVESSNGVRKSRDFFGIKSAW